MCMSICITLLSLVSLFLSISLFVGLCLYVLIHLSTIAYDPIGVLCGGVVRVSDFFVQSQTPNLKVGGSIPDATTFANLDFHHGV